MSMSIKIVAINTLMLITSIELHRYLLNAYQLQMQSFIKAHDKENEKI